MFSTNYSKDVVHRFYDWAKQRNESKFWMNDQHGTGDRLTDETEFAIQNSRLVVAFCSDSYFESNSCIEELNYADSLRKEIIIVKLRNELQLAGRGGISLIISAKLYVSAKHVL